MTLYWTRPETSLSPVPVRVGGVGGEGPPAGVRVEGKRVPPEGFVFHPTEPPVTPTAPPASPDQ